MRRRRCLAVSLVKINPARCTFSTRGVSEDPTTEFQSIQSHQISGLIHRTARATTWARFGLRQGTGEVGMQKRQWRRGVRRPSGVIAEGGPNLLVRGARRDDRRRAAAVGARQARFSQPNGGRQRSRSAAERRIGMSVTGGVGLWLGCGVGTRWGDARGLHDRAGRRRGERWLGLELWVGGGGAGVRPSGPSGD